MEALFLSVAVYREEGKCRHKKGHERARCNCCWCDTYNSSDRKVLVLIKGRNKKRNGTEREERAGNV